MLFILRIGLVTCFRMIVHIRIWIGVTHSIYYHILIIVHFISCYPIIYTSSSCNGFLFLTPCRCLTHFWPLCLGAWFSCSLSIVFLFSIYIFLLKSIGRLKYESWCGWIRSWYIYMLIFKKGWHRLFINKNMWFFLFAFHILFSTHLIWSL